MCGLAPQAQRLGRHAARAAAVRPGLVETLLPRGSGPRRAARAGAHIIRDWVTRTLLSSSSAPERTAARRGRALAAACQEMWGFFSIRVWHRGRERAFVESDGEVEQAQMVRRAPQVERRLLGVAPARCILLPPEPC